MSPDMKYFLWMHSQVKYLFTILFCFCVINKSSAQTNNIYLDGDNYILLNDPAFPKRVDWNNASEQRLEMTSSQLPVKTYWFSHNGKSYIIINVTNDKSQLYIELGANKKSYHFPADLLNSEKVGTYNRLTLQTTNTSGVLQELIIERGNHLSVNVLQLDSLHVKLSFSGTITPYSNPGGKGQLEIDKALPPIAISGKISLSKKTPGLDHLPDTYAGCDNTIYNEMSPDYAGGQYYSATNCEESFYKKVFKKLNDALSPSINYLRSQGWDVSNAPKYTPLKKRIKSDLTHFFRTNPNGVDYDLDVSANPMKGAYHDFLQKILADATGGSSKLKELEALQKEEPAKFKLHLQVSFNQPVSENYKLDLSHAQIKKINDNIFLIENVKNTSNFTFHDDGGVYLFVGKWNNPAFKEGYISASPIFQANAPKLSIQAMYIRIGCGEELAAAILKNINMQSLQKIINTNP